MNDIITTWLNQYARNLVGTTAEKELQDKVFDQLQEAYKRGYIACGIDT